MISIQVNSHEFRCDDLFNAIGDYLTNIASAVLSVFKRIFCMNDAITAQDINWNNQECNRLRRENKELNQTIQSLKRKVHCLENPKGYSCIRDFFIEVVLFFTLCPLYIMSLPVTILRAAMRDAYIFLSHK